MDATGFGAGFVEGASKGEQLNIQRDQMKQAAQYRGLSLGLEAQKFMLDQARLTHQDAREFFDNQQKQHDSLMQAITKGLESGKSEVWHQDPAQWDAILNNVATSEHLLAAAKANAYGGDQQAHLGDVHNADLGLLGASTSLTDKAFAKALSDRIGVTTGNAIGLPQAEGAAAGMKDLAAAQGGGGAAAGIIRGAQEQVTPRVLPNAQASLVYPPGGGPAVAPTPQASVVPGGGFGGPVPQMPALPRVPVQQGPLPTAPQPPQGQPGTAPNVAIPGMAPATYEAESALGKQFGSEQEQKLYRGTQTGMQMLYQILSSADKLNQEGGFQNTGAGANFRNEVAKQVNSWAGAFGVDQPFDAAKVGSWEDMTKNTRLMGMQVVSSFFGGSREAQGIVSAGINSVPGAENTPLGVRLVGSGIEQALLRSTQMHDFVAQQLSQNKPIATAESEFNRANPPGLYAMRGIANAVPDGYVKALQANPQLAPEIDRRFGRGVAEFILRGGRTGLGAAGGFTGLQ